MATNTYYSLRTLHYHHHHHHHHHSLSRLSRHSLLDMSNSSSSSASSSLFLNPTNNVSSSSSSSSFSTFLLLPITSSYSSSFPAAAAAVAPSSSTSTTQPPISFDVLEQYLTAQNFRLADDETRRLLIALAGEPAIKRGYVFFSEVQYIQESDLKAIDSLWTKHSDNKFGYSVQKRLWDKSNRDFTNFFIKLGWMKKLDTEVEQYNYKSFPNEFIWELNQETPQGHLPLTNALRGTQLFQNILLHPAFADDTADADADKQQGRGIEEKEDTTTTTAAGGNASNIPNLLKRIFKPNYSF